MQGLSGYSSLLLQIMIFVGAFYLLFILPQKKKETKVRQMLDSLQVGDDIMTIGGIIGKITHIKDGEISIETALERTKIKMAKWSIKSVEKGK